MSQTQTAQASRPSLLLVPLVGLISGAAHAAAWHFIPLLVVSAAVSMVAVGLLWAVASNSGASRGAAGVTALIAGLLAILSSWAVWLALVFGVDGVRQMLSIGGVEDVMANVGFYLDLFEISISRRGQSTTIRGDELRVFWMIMTGIWIAAPLAGALFRKT